MLYKKCIISIVLFALTCSICYAEGITLTWTPNTEGDLAGYKVYYGYSSGPPYDGTDIYEGISPIILHIDPAGDPDYFVDNTGERCEYTLTGLDLTSGDYWLVLTAYDNETPEYNESGYSNEVNTFDDPEPPPGDDGGSSGCFISSAEADRDLFIKAGSLFLAITAMLSGITLLIKELSKNVKTLLSKRMSNKYSIVS